VAAAARAQWDGWLSRMPPGPRAALIRRLQDRHDEQVRAAVAELVTFVLLDSVYPAIEADPETGSGSRTDFAVDVPVRTHLEVHRPAPPRQSAMDARRLGDIAAELEKIKSPDFWLDVDPQSGAQVPSMRQVRRQAEDWLASLDYETEVRRRDEYQQARRVRESEPMPGLDASPAERAAYFAGRRPFEPPAFTRSGDGWSVRITAHPRPADQRGPGKFTVGLRSAGAAHLETFEGLQAAVRGKLRQHAGLADPLVVVLDLSSPIIEGPRHRRDALRADSHDDAGPVHPGDYDPGPGGGHLARSGSPAAPPGGRAGLARDMARESEEVGAADGKGHRETRVCTLLYHVRASVL
jgi:hypothetical protein